MATILNYVQLQASNTHVLKAVFAAALATASVAFGSYALAASSTSQVAASVVAAIAITNPSSLVFGQFMTAPAAAVGSITVSTSGVRTATGATPLAGSAPTAARFDVSGGANSTYSITQSGSTMLTGPVGASMALTKFSDFNANNTTSGVMPATGTLNSSGMQSIYVGGTLTTSASQAAGNYTGAIIVAVEYN